VIDIVISALEPRDFGEVFTLQRAAYVSEAQIYGDIAMPALTQTLGELADELSAGLGLKATLGHRMVGAVRAHAKGAVLHIGRLTVAPDMQGRGIGTRLLTALERRAPATVHTFTLFTGHLSTANLRLYERLGYAEVRREALKPGTVLVHLDKPATG
jgi:ribosomal protein S18 acetylase RimI-like enzyme